MVKIEAIPAYSDNYIWLIRNAGETWVVDPGEAQGVVAALEQLDSPLTGILLTHHHFDHVGGVEDLVHIYQPRVIGPGNPQIKHVDQRVGKGESITAAGLNFEVLEIPGHTLDHIAYLAREHTPPLLFCGDTLFAGGCGRVFEGTAAMMYQSLQQLASLPPSTQVYCAHEYTLANLAFAQAVEPSNEMLTERLARDKALRSQQRPTIPSTLEEELQTNPFLRCDQPEVALASQSYSGRKAADAVAVFADIRAWKNDF